MQILDTNTITEYLIRTSDGRTYVRRFYYRRAEVRWREVGTKFEKNPEKWPELMELEKDFLQKQSEEEEAETDASPES